MKSTVTRDVYCLDDLEPAAREKAIETLTADAWDDIQADDVSEELNGQFVFMATGECVGAVSDRELHKKYGAKIGWQLSFTQSDGAVVSGRLERATLPRLDWPYNVSAIEIRQGNFMRSEIVCVEPDTDADGYEIMLTDVQREKAADMVAALNNTMYRFAQQACIFRTSEEYVIDMYNANGLRYRFAADGSLVDYPFWTDGDEVTA